MRLKQWVGDKLVKTVARVVPPRLMVKRKYFELFQARGYHVTPVQFYQPIPDTRALPSDLWERQTELVGVDLNESGQLALLPQLEQFRDEYSQFPLERPDDPARYWVRNETFTAVDGEVLHGMIRHLRPRRMIEVGSGRSTLIAAPAADANAKDGFPCDFTVIDPYPMEVLTKGLPGITRIIEKLVQNVSLDTFAPLGPGDILFIDSTHVASLNTDVVYLFNEVIPRVAPGVTIHLHDIFLPAQYPREWAEIARFFWNEQYLLQSFLSFNDRFEVIWASHFMHLRHPEKLAAAFPSYPHRPWPPSSFWMKRIR